MSNNISKINQNNIAGPIAQNNELISSNTTSMPSSLMIKLLKKVCNIQQPGSLTQNYFYNFNKAKRYK